MKERALGNLRFAIDSDGIALIGLDVAGRRVNVFTPAFTEELAHVVERLAGDPSIVGAVIVSAKDSGFMLGADLLDLVHVHERGLSPEQASGIVAPAAAVLRQLERCGKRVAVVIDGLALGGGFELCLACHYRVMSEGTAAAVGLPEVNVGLLPAGGGTQRLPRLVGIEKALPLLLSGRQVEGPEALQLGLVDELVAPEDALKAARAWVLSDADPRQPWDTPGFSIPGGAGAMAPHAGTSFGVTLARLRRDTQDNYPAPAAILSCIYHGTQLPIDRALALEAAHFGKLLAGPVARNLIRTLFISKGEARKLARRPAGVARGNVTRLGVLGLGMMGAGIAQAAAAAGIAVVAVEVDDAAAAAGKVRAASGYDRAVRQGRLSQAEADQRLARITATADYAALADCEMVIEAVFESRQVKRESYRRVLEGLGDMARPGFVMASNTSTLPVSSLARDWPKPDEFIGLHFFSPVDRMELVEVILGEKTSPATLARALDLVAQLRKTPIIVKDSPGFYTSRIFCAYIDEAMAMLSEGVAPALIENAATQAGFAMPPLGVTDEVSLDLQDRVIRQARNDGLPARFQRQHAEPVVVAMISHGRLGRKAGGGFHDFAPGQPRRLWPSLSKLFPVAGAQPDVDTLKKRLLYMQALESARCLEENVVTCAADADLGSILALGFPKWTGGTLSLIDTVGMSQFVADCDALADSVGERFRPSAWLREKASSPHPFFYARTRKQAGPA